MSDTPDERSEEGINPGSLPPTPASEVLHPVPGPLFARVGVFRRELSRFQDFQASTRIFGIV